MSDRDSAPWWEALAGGELRLQRCEGCATLRWPARAMCHRCGQFGWEWRASTGHGEVASWIRSHRTFLPDVPAPSVVLLVRLADGPGLLLPGGWDGTGDPVVGQPVELSIGDTPRLMWRPA